jgi:adenylate kinase
MNLLLLGPQGSGKGTQAKRLADEHGIPHISTGDMFRLAMLAGTPLGLEIKPIYDRGDLVPDDLTVALIRERLVEPDAAAGFVLDGFPRNLAQAEALDVMLTDIGRTLDAILFFDLDDETATVRALGRAHEEGRADDTPEGIARRLALYHEVTEPVVEYYRVTGKLVPVHAERSVDAVYAEIEDALRLLDVEARA